MPTEFSGRIAELQRRVGRGRLRGVVGFGENLANYAIPQHRGAWYNFMGRYGPKTMHQPRKEYLSRAVDTDGDRAFEDVAEEVLGAGGPRVGMDRAVRRVKGTAVTNAPERSGDLKRSAYTRQEG